MKLVEMFDNSLKYFLTGFLALAESSLVLTRLFQNVLYKFYLLQERKQ